MGAGRQGPPGAQPGERLPAGLRQGRARRGSGAPSSAPKAARRAARALPRLRRAPSGRRPLGDRAPAPHARRAGRRGAAPRAEAVGTGSPLRAPFGPAARSWQFGDAAGPLGGPGCPAAPEVGEPGVAPAPLPRPPPPRTPAAARLSRKPGCRAKAEENLGPPAPIGRPRRAARGGDWLPGAVSRGGRSLRRGSAAGLGCSGSAAAAPAGALGELARRRRGPHPAAPPRCRSRRRRGGAAEETEREAAEAAEK